MDLWLLILARIVHVVASVCWAGGAFILFLFIEPTAKTLAPDGNKFLQHMIARGRFGIFMTVSSTLTVLSGIPLFWQDAGGNLLAWAQTGPGLGFTLGTIAGIAVFVVGMFLIRPRADELGRLGSELQLAGGPPSPAQVAKLQTLGQEMASLGKIDFVLLVAALVLMGTARYWWF